jgi:dihydroorotate dehydrogenase
VVKLSNDHEFQYMAASGALSFDGTGWPWEQPLRWTGLLDERLFTTVIKTLTLSPRKGNLRLYNPLGCIRFLPDGVLNAVGLTNPGVEWWCREVGPSIDSSYAPVMGSILGEPDELIKMAEMLNEFDLVGLEINASCPNTNDDLLANTEKIIRSCEEVESVSYFPIILKLSVVHDVARIVEGVEDIVEAFSINSVPWSRVFPDKQSPLAHLGGGGVSGKIVQPFTWDLVRELKTMTDIPVIGPSIWEYSDLERLWEIGVDAFDFGSIFLRYPLRPTAFVRRHTKENRE